MGVRRIHWVIAISVLLMSVTMGFAQTTQPAAAKIAPGKFDSVAIHAQVAPSATTPATSQAATDDSSGDGSLDYERVVLALAIVIGLILLTRWASKKIFPGAVTARNSGAMKVMSRLVISPKQQLLMVQVGRRIVVVGDSGGQMAAVSEITDADEVASLVAQLTEDKSIQLTKGFGSLFNRASNGFESPADSNAADSNMEEDESASADSPSAEEPVIGDARGEISGLMDKVRLLSSQFRRS